MWGAIITMSEHITPRTSHQGLSKDLLRNIKGTSGIIWIDFIPWVSDAVCCETMPVVSPIVHPPNISEYRGDPAKMSNLVPNRRLCAAVVILYMKGPMYRKGQGKKSVLRKSR